MRGANGNDNDVCVLEVELEVGGLGVADGDGSIGSVQQLGDGTTDDVASADDDGVLAGKLDTSLLEQGDDSLGGAGSEDGLAAALGELTNVVGAEAVNILLVCDGGGDVGLRDVLRKRQLDEDTVDRVVVVEAKDLLEELDLGNVLGEVKQLAVDAGLGEDGMLVRHCLWMSRAFSVEIYLFSGLELHAHIGSCERGQRRFKDEPIGAWGQIRIEG